MNRKLARAAETVAFRLLLLRLNVLLSNEQPDVDLRHLADNLRELAAQLEEHAVHLEQARR